MFKFFGSILICLIIIFSLCSCGFYQDNDKDNQDDVHSEYGEVIDDYSYSASWNNYYSVVKIENGNVTGNGVIWDVDEKNNRLIIVTASHVLVNTQQDIIVTFCDGARAMATDFVTDLDRDVAFVVIDDSALENSVNYKSISINENEDLEKGDVVYALDLEEKDSDYTVETKEGILGIKIGVVNDPWIYMDDFNQHMIYVMMNVQPGMSGGGLFNEDEELVGILSGIDGEGNAAAIPVSVIQAVDISQNF